MDLSKFTKDGQFLMLALDQRGSFQKIMNPQAPETVADQEMVAIKKEIINALYDQFSGILIDPSFGLPAYKGNTKPYLLCVEKSGYKELNGEKITQLEYTANELKQLGASGIKLNLQFNPNSTFRKDQLVLAQKVIADSHICGLPLFLEIITYDPMRPPNTLFSLVKASVKIFLENNIVPDVFKLQYPGDPHDCDEITNMLGDIPWILLTGGEEYQQFKKELEIAVLHGASGFLAGRSIWQEIGQYNSREERNNFLQTVAKSRFKEIVNIVGKKAFIA